MHMSVYVRVCVCVCVLCCVQSFLEVYKTARRNRLPYEDLQTLGDAIRVLFRAAEVACRVAKKRGQSLARQCEVYDEVLEVLSAFDSVFIV